MSSFNEQDIRFSIPSKPLLSSTPRPPARLKSLMSLSSIVIYCTSFAAAFALAFFASSPASVVNHARPLSKLSRPTVIVISFDGFRFGYHLKAPTPNIRRLIAKGTSAEEGLIPVFPSLTFPNHYSIATGLFPPYHGIINNYFLDPVSGEQFSTKNHELMWWLGEPLWQTVARHGLNAAAIFWAGCEVKGGFWTCPPNFCPKYNSSLPFEQRVDSALGFFDLPAEDVPVLVMLYFEDPDSQGHVFGPDHPEITKAIARMDTILGRLISGLQQRGIFEDVTIILLGDHGMAGTCDEKYIFLEELSPWIQIKSDWVISADTLLTINPPPEISSQEAVAKIHQGLSSGKVRNGDKLRVFQKEDLPERFHYEASERIPPIVGVVEEGYMVKYKRERRYACGGGHGYDNLLMSMRSFFVAHGPRIPQGRNIPSFQNVEVYNLVTTILKVEGAPNNGSAVFADSILLPEYA